MSTKTATASIVLDKRYDKGDGTYPVKLRITHNRISRFYGTMFSVSESDYESINSVRTDKSLKDIKAGIFAIVKKATGIIDELPAFSFDAFKAKLLGKHVASAKDKTDVYAMFDDYIEVLERENQIGTSANYKCAMSSLKKYRQKLSFEQVTVKFLKGYETKMRADGCRVTTISMYLRCLRTICNRAKTSGAMPANLYPFGSDTAGLYNIPTGAGHKRALSMANIKKIFEYKPVSDAEHLYRDIWLFSYLCNGANMKDICLLKFGNIKGDTIEFIRQKTMRTTKETKDIVAAYTKDMQAIVQRWQNKRQTPENYIFPFLSIGDDERAIKTKVGYLVKLINKYMNRIAKACDINIRLTTYVARHSFVTALVRKGLGHYAVKELIGHGDIKSTDNYIGSIIDEERNNIASLLTDFDS